MPAEGALTGKLEREPTFDIEKLPRWLRDAIDLNNELTASQTGRETGRAKRFLPDDHPDGPEAQRREKERRFDALMRRLTDPAYAALYISTAETVTRAEDAALRASAKLTREAEKAATHLEALRANAAVLPDGRKIFKDVNGRIHAEDGSDVTMLADGTVSFTAESPSWEEFKHATDRAAELERQRLEIEEYRERILEPAKLRLSDGEDPPSEDELREIGERVKKSVPGAVRAEYESAMPEAELSANKPAAERYLAAATLNAPDLPLEFRTAHDGPATGSGPGPKLSPS